MAIIVTRHAIERYRQRIGPRKASPTHIIRAIKRVIAREEQVKRIDHYFVAYYFLAGEDCRAGYFKAIVARDGRNYVVVTILSPQEAEHGYARRLHNMRERQQRQMRALRQSLEIQATAIPCASRNEVEKKGS